MAALIDYVIYSGIGLHCQECKPTAEEITCRNKIILLILVVERSHGACLMMQQVVHNGDDLTDTSKLFSTQDRFLRGLIG